MKFFTHAPMRHFYFFSIVFVFVATPIHAQILAWQRFVTNPTAFQNASSLGCGMDVHRPNAAAIGPDGNIVVTGCANGTIATVDTSTSYFDMFTAKINIQTGAEIWRINASSSVRNAGFSVAIDSVGDVFVAGLRDGIPTISKFAGATGQPIWALPLSSADVADSEIALVLDVENNLIVTSNIVLNQRSNTITAKLRGSDGTTIWQKSAMPEGALSYASRNFLTKLDSAGNLYVALICACYEGSLLFIQKRSALDGTSIWRTQNNPELDWLASLSGLTLDVQGSVFVSGALELGTGPSAFVAKFNGSNGQPVWRTRNGDSTITNSAQNAIAVHPSGDIVVTGYAANTTKWVIRTSRYNSQTGTLVWNRDLTNGLRGRDQAAIGGRAIAVDTAGNIVITGKQQVLADNDESTAAHTAMYDGNGNLAWHHTFENAYSGAGQIILLTADKQIIELGTHFIGTGSTAISTIRRLNESGQIIGSAIAPAMRDAVALPGSKRLDASGIVFGLNDRLSGLSPSAIDQRGDLFVTGNITGQRGQRQLMTIKTDGSNGNELWRTVHPSGVNPDHANTGSTVAIDSEGAVFVAAGSSVPEGLIYAKYRSTDGAILWSFIAAQSQSTGIFASSVIGVDLQNNLLGAGGNGIYKIGGATGAKIWASSFAADGITGVVAQSLTVDRFGDVNVGYRSIEGKFVIVKFSGTNGGVIWHRIVAVDTTLSPGAITIPSTITIAVDKNGDVAATATAMDPGVGRVIQIIKVARLDGEILWDTTYDGSSGNYGVIGTQNNTIDRANNLKIDSSGNVLVTGMSTELGETYSMRTLKLAGTDGRILWNKGIITSTSSMAYGLAVTANDDVIVTGFTNNTFQCMTAKYRADGRSLWQYGRGAPNRICSSYSVHDLNGATYVTGLVGSDTSRGTWSSAKLIDPTASIDATLTLSSNINPVSNGVPVTLTARVTNGSPTGLIRFKVDNTTVATCGSVTPINQVANCTLSLITGRRIISAELSGDTIHMGATQTLEIVVNSDAEKIVPQASDFDRNGVTELVLSTPTGFSIWAPGVRATSANLPNVGAGFKPTLIGTLGQNRDSAIVWRHDNGGLIITRMSAMRVSETRNYGIYADYGIAAFTDLDGDGYDDILWRHTTTGNLYVWFMDTNANVNQVAAWGGADNTWTVSGVGDLNNDGRADIVWRHTSGAIYTYTGTANRTFTVEYIGQVEPNWNIRKVADFDGDGKVDLLWTQAQSGATVIWKMDGVKLQRLVVLTDLGNPASIVAFGDLNGDGRTDIVFQGTTPNKNSVYLLAGNWTGRSVALFDQPSGTRVLELQN